MPLTLVFEHAGKVTLEVPVEGTAAGRGPGHDDSMDHGEHGAIEGAVTPATGRAAQALIGTQRDCACLAPRYRGFSLGCDRGGRGR